MADRFDPLRVQAKATIEKIMETKTIAVDTTSSFATRVEPAIGSTLSTQANNLARAFSELGNVPKIFGVRPSDMPDVRELIVQIHDFGQNVDATLQIFLQWNRTFDTDPQRFVTMQQLIHSSHQLIQLLKDIFENGKLGDVPVDKLNEFITKRNALYDVVKGTYKRESLVQVVSQANSVQAQIRAAYDNATPLDMTLIDRLVSHISEIRQSYQEYVAIKDDITAVFTLEQQIPPPRNNIQVRRFSILQGIADCESFLRNLDNTLRFLTEVRTDEVRRNRDGRGNIRDVTHSADTPQAHAPSPVTAETAQAARQNDAEIDQIIRIMGMLKADIATKQTQIASKLEQLRTDIQQNRRSIATLTEKSTDEEFRLVTDKLTQIRQKETELQTEITALEVLTRQLGTELTRETNSLENAHNKLKEMLDDKSDEITRNLKRDFTRIITDVKRIIDEDGRVKADLLALQGTLDALQIQLESRKFSAASQSALQAERLALEAEKSAQRTITPIIDATKTGDHMTQDAKTIKGSAMASTQRRVKLDAMANSYKDKRQLLLFTMELIIRQRLNLAQYKDVAKEANVCKNKIMKTFAADKLLNMRDMTSALKKALPQIGDETSQFITHLPPEISSGLPKETHMLETLLTDFGNIENELEEFTKRKN